MRIYQYLVSKPTDVIQGNRYLALISSDYLDSKDGDARGEFSILSTKGMKEKAKVEDDLFAEGEILLDDLVDKSNHELRKVFPEINRTAEEQKVDIEKLKSMFLLDEETLGSLKFALNDSDSTILERVYKADAIKIAKLDAEMKSHLERLDTLDTTSPSFDDDFGAIIQEFSKTIPLQNRSALTQYVSRRNAVLVVFEKILNKKLNIQQNSTRNNDEKLLHNLFFKQKSEDTQASDLWVLNEEFIYFDGASELEIRDLKINNTNLIKQELTDEEKEFLVSQTSTKTRTERRPDVFLYPGEGKCILIELKNPNVDVSEHLNQLNKYATIIRNLARPEFDFMTFYGYLIGEKIDPKEVIIADGDFKHAPNLDYLFRPSKGIPHFFGKLPGEMYMEVLKYSTLLQRAKLRNKTFSEKLLGKHITF